MRLRIRNLWSGDLYRLSWWKSSWRQFVKIVMVTIGVVFLSLSVLVAIVVIVAVVS